MNRMVRRGLVAAVLLTLLPSIASTQPSQRYVFAWAYDYNNNVYFSNSSMSVDYYDYGAAVRRWDLALERNNLKGSVRNSTAGTPGDIFYDNYQAAEDARYRMINQERNSYGKNTVALAW